MWSNGVYRDVLTYTEPKTGSVKELVALGERQTGENGQKATGADEHVVDDQRVNSWQTAGKSTDDATNGVADTDHRNEKHGSGGFDACQLGSICGTERRYFWFNCFLFFNWHALDFENRTQLSLTLSNLHSWVLLSLFFFFPFLLRPKCFWDTAEPRLRESLRIEQNVW